MSIRLLLLTWPAMLLASQKALPVEMTRTVTLYSQFAHPAAVFSIEQMKTELDAIMAPLDVHFDWRSLEQANGHQVSAELMVVNFKGECQADWLPPLAKHAGALGWTHISDGQILPFADVDCDLIRDLITHPLAVAPPTERARMLGRAMARVLAHELYHFLLNTTRHASTGIAKASYTATELASECLRFDDAQLRLVQSAPSRSRLGKSGTPRGAGGLMSWTASKAVGHGFKASR